MPASYPLPRGPENTHPDSTPEKDWGGVNTASVGATLLQFSGPIRP